MNCKAYIIVPCYNEGGQLRTTVTELLEHGYHVVVVDDGSSKSAWDSLSDLPIHFLRHGINLGQGAALQTGMDYCRKIGAKAIVHFDADGQHSVEDVPRLLEALEDSDVALGSRFLQKDGASAIPPTRRLLLRCARLVNFIFTGLWLTDAHNGLRALNAAALSKIDLKENRMAHATEILLQIKSNGLRWKEVPCTVKYTDYSRKKGQKWYNSIDILLELILNRMFF